MPYVRKIGSINQIRVFLENSGKHVYSEEELTAIIDANRQHWDLAQTTPAYKLAERFVKNEIIRAEDIHFDNGTVTRRYVFGEASIYEIAVSLRSRSYISHFPAVFLLGLTNQIPKTIYTTQELSEKRIKKIDITQKTIDHAFSQPQRRSELKGVYQQYAIILLSGKHAWREGVISSKVGYSYTGLERTLIDITVRPNYSGGAFTVLEAYRQAREQGVSVNKLSAILQKISYIYPYEQAVGFYLEKAGFEKKYLDLIRKKMEFDFYLDYDMKDPQYSSEWRIYYPKGM